MKPPQSRAKVRRFDEADETPKPAPQVRNDEVDEIFGDGIDIDKIMADKRQE